VEKRRLRDISAIIGNSRLLATFSPGGEIVALFWPRPDGGQHLQKLRQGLVLDAGQPPLWFGSATWRVRQNYSGDTNILETTYRHRQAGLEVKVQDAVLPEDDVLVRVYEIRNLGVVPRRLSFLTYAAVRLDESPLYNTCLYHEPEQSLVFYRRGQFLALGGTGPVVGWACDAASALWKDLERGLVERREIQMGEAAGALAWDLGELGPGAVTSFSFYLVLGKTFGEVIEKIARYRGEKGAALLQEVADADRRYLARSSPSADLPAEVERVYRRSLLALKLMAGQEGGIIAAPEFDPEYRFCGGYGYVWGRDAVYIALALDRAGYHAEAEAFYLWAARVQEPEGFWIQRYTLEGNWGPSWGLLQIDETGSILFGLWEHYRLTQNGQFLQRMWETTRRGAYFLLAHRDRATGLPVASVDLWEENVGQFTYSAVAVWAGLEAAAKVALELGHREEALAWAKEADTLQRRIKEELWDRERGRFLRARKVTVDPRTYEYLAAQGEAVGWEARQESGIRWRGVLQKSPAEPHWRMSPEPKPNPAEPVRYFRQKDASVDCSLLGLTFPFAFLPADDEAMVATARAVAAELSVPRSGGIRRYQGDRYRGGNPWVICTLWLGLYQARRGDFQGAAEKLQWVLDHRNPLDLLPEQVDQEKGGPAWVIPLAWSHAMFMLLVQELAARGYYRQVKALAED